MRGWKPDWEGIEGNDIAGYVETVGNKVTEFKKGDRVGFPMTETSHPLTFVSFLMLTCKLPLYL